MNHYKKTAFLPKEINFKRSQDTVKLDLVDVLTAVEIRVEARNAEKARVETEEADKADADAKKVEKARADVVQDDIARADAPAEKARVDKETTMKVRF